MDARPYSEFDEAPAAYESTGSGVGGKIFIWIAWAVAAMFWGFVITSTYGILTASDNPAIGAPGGSADAGGLGFLLMDVIGGVFVLGLAIAWGTARWASRDKSQDPLTEAATRRVYDLAEAAGGDDDIHRGPGARRPEQRDAAHNDNS